jgi:esterase/lipase
MTYFKHTFIIRTLLFIVIFIVVTMLVRRLVIIHSHRLHKKHLKDFESVNELGYFTETSVEYYFPHKKIDHIVLLIHGYLGSPYDMIFLREELKKHNIAFFAPRILGFGLSDTSLLHEVNYKDWLRQADEVYYVLSQQANRISVVGHSMGAMLATYIAEKHNIEHLILVSPGHFPNETRHKTLLQMPVISSLIKYIFPVMPKPSLYQENNLDVEAKDNTFGYITTPVNSVVELLNLQDHIHITRTHSKHLTIVHGRQDHAINAQKLIQLLEAKQMPFEEYQFDGAAHNLLLDYDHDIAVEMIVDKLLSE